MPDNVTVSNLIHIASPILLGGAIWLTVTAAHLITTKMHSSRLRSALTLLDAAVLAAVREVQQVLVGPQKAASVHGVLTPAQRSDAKQTALASAKVQMGHKGVALLEDAFGLAPAEVESVIAGRIEAAVHRLRGAPTYTQWRAGTAGDPVPFTG